MPSKSHRHRKHEDKHPLDLDDNNLLDEQTDYYPPLSHQDPAGGDSHHHSHPHHHHHHHHHGHQRQPSDVPPTAVLSYQSFPEFNENESPIVFPFDKSGPRPWQHHINDLDSFFLKIYRYHQYGGFYCMVISQTLELLQFLFIVFFTLFMIHGIKYDVLFGNSTPTPSTTPPPTTTQKVTIAQCIKPLSDIQLSGFEVLLLIFAFVFWILKIVKVIHNCFVNLAIKQFYLEVLGVHDPSKYTWQEVQTRLISKQQSLLLSNAVRLDELGLHNRVLRHDNYLIAMVNRALVPIHYRLPIVGSEVVFFTNGLKYNLELLIFRGPFKVIFEHNWKIRDDIKCIEQRQVCAQQFSRACVQLGLLNLILFPIIFVYQILTTFYANAEQVKRDPSLVFGSRNWSLYGRWYVRHFNELDHSLNNRLNRAYKPAAKYMASFTSPMAEIIARHVGFVAGAIFAALAVLLVYDESVLNVEHLLTVMSGSVIVLSISRAFISPEIPIKFSQSELHAQVLEVLHCIPDAGKAPYTEHARKVMSDLFQYKIVRMLEELISPIVTPYILLRHLRTRSQDIVDFFRMNTIEINGMGDVCTFAMMNPKENGNPLWIAGNVSSPSCSDDTRDGSSRSASGSGSGTSFDSSHTTDANNEPIELPELPALARGTAPPSSLQPTGVTAPPYIDPYSGPPSLQPGVGVPQRFPHALVTENGKLELSLINFKLTNPSWRPYNDSQAHFIERVAQRATEVPPRASRMAETQPNNLQRSQDQEKSATQEEEPQITSSHSAAGLFSSQPDRSIFSEGQPNEQMTTSGALSRERSRLLAAFSGPLAPSGLYDQTDDVSQIDARDEAITAMSLSTLYLHEQAASHLASSSGFRQPPAGFREQRETQPLLTRNSAAPPMHGYHTTSNQ